MRLASRLTFIVAFGLSANFFIAWPVCFFATRAINDFDRGTPSEVALARRHFGWDQPELAVLRYSGPAVREAIVFPHRLDPLFSANAAVQMMLQQSPGVADPGSPVFNGPLIMNNIIETRAGWPFEALVGWQINANDAKVTNSGVTGVLGGFKLTRDSGGNSVVRLLPSSPIWPGLIANTFLYASAIMGVMMLWSKARTSVRLRRGLCPTCKYPIDVSEVCTECGAELAEWALLRAKAPRPQAAR